MCVHVCVCVCVCACVCVCSDFEGAVLRTMKSTQKMHNPHQTQATTTCMSATTILILEIAIARYEINGFLSKFHCCKLSIVSNLHVPVQTYRTCITEDRVHYVRMLVDVIAS